MLSATLLAVSVFWTFEPGVIDVLEYSTGDGCGWVVIPGPYNRTADGTEYSVPITADGPMKLFRVNRWWGEPWVNP
jgi:hypothetical protein